VINSVDLLGFVAGTLTTVAFAPQVAKTWRTRSAGDLSGSMFVVFGSGVFLWLIYGVMIGSIPVILANAVTFALAAAIAILKYRFDPPG